MREWSIPIALVSIIVSGLVFMLFVFLLMDNWHWRAYAVLLVGTNIVAVIYILSKDPKK